MRTFKPIKEARTTSTALIRKYSTQVENLKGQYAGNHSAQVGYMWIKNLLSFLPILHSGDCYGDVNAVKEIKEMLNSKVTHRWYQIGVILGVPVSKLEEIRLDEELAGDRESESAMFTNFLSSDSNILQPTWQLLVDAVGHKAGGNNQRLAETLSSRVAEKFPGMFYVF